MTDKKYSREILDAKEMQDLVGFIKDSDVDEKLSEIHPSAPWLFNIGIAMSTMVKGVRAYMGSNGNPVVMDSSFDIALTATRLLECSGVDSKDMYRVLFAGMTSLAEINPKTKESKVSEKDYHDEIINSFHVYFPDLEFIDSEVQVDIDDRDRIDILAKDSSERPVIIELKLGKTSAHKQLRSYAVGFEDPLLINISEILPNNMRSDIRYMTFKEIGIPFSNYDDVQQLVSEGMV